MSTIGYGDLYPNTDFGRTLIVGACAMAIFCVVLLVIGFRAYFAPTARELKVFEKIKYVKWRRELKWQAAVVLQSFWRSLRSLDASRGEMKQLPQYLQDTTLRIEIEKFQMIKL